MSQSHSHRLKECLECHRVFPSHLIHDFETGTKRGRTEVPDSLVPMCPICAYVRINAERGLPAGTPPPESAPKARAIFMEAKNWLETNRRAHR